MSSASEKSTNEMLIPAIFYLCNLFLLISAKKEASQDFSQSVETIEYDKAASSIDQTNDDQDLRNLGSWYDDLFLSEVTLGMSLRLLSYLQ